MVDTAFKHLGTELGVKRAELPSGHRLARAPGLRIGPPRPRLRQSALALELKVPAPRINDIVRERRAVTPDTALRLSRYFGTSPEFWMDLQTAFDLKTAAKDSGGKIEAEISPRAA